MILAPPKETGRQAHKTPTAQSKAQAPNCTPTQGVPQRLRLPPCGRKLFKLRDRGEAPSIAVLITDRWEVEAIWDEHAPWVLIVPEGNPAAAFDFRCVAGLFVYIIADEADRADEIAAQVWRFHPRMVYSWSADSDIFTFHARGIE